MESENFSVRTVLSYEVADYYKVADIFSLASLNEGLARVFLESMSYGLPCLVHDYSITRFTFGYEGYFGDFTKEGSLTDLICKVLGEECDKFNYYQRYRYIYERFS